MQLSAARNGPGPQHMSLVGEINARCYWRHEVRLDKRRTFRPRELTGALFSPGEKQGSTFSFWLPLTSECAMELPAENMTPRKQELNFADLTQVVQHPHLLLVEDNKVNQVIIK